MSEIVRRKTPSVKVGNIFLGSEHPVAVQSMTNTATDNVKQTVAQILELHRAGSELVRLTVNDDKAALAVPQIARALRRKDCDVPLIGDFHFNGHVILQQFPECARTLDKYRINPGNVGHGKLHDERFSQIIHAALKYNKPVRIGVNLGSLDKELLMQAMNANAKSGQPLSYKEVVFNVAVASALKSAAFAEKLGIEKSKIVLSVKMSGVQDTVDVNRRLAKMCDYVLHVGLTEAGGGLHGVTGSVASLAILLQEGIGDTVRISLTPAPHMKRSYEVQVCRSLLQSMGFRYFGPRITSCPGCGRTDNDRHQRLAKDIETYIEKKLPELKAKYPGVEKLHIAVMGCIVNGPGESQNADIGISLPGKSESPIIPVFIEGRKAHTIRGKNVKEKFLKILEAYIKTRYRKK